MGKPSLHSQDGCLKGILLKQACGEKIKFKKRIKGHSETSSKKVYLLKIWDHGGQESIVAEVWKSQLLNISGLFSVGAAGIKNR